MYGALIVRVPIQFRSETERKSECEREGKRVHANQSPAFVHKVRGRSGGKMARKVTIKHVKWTRYASIDIVRH